MLRYRGAPSPWMAMLTRRHTSAPVTAPHWTPNPTRRHVNWSMTTSPVAPEHDRLAAKQVHAPEAVSGVADERQPRGSGSARSRAIVFRQHAIHDVVPTKRSVWPPIPYCHLGSERGAPRQCVVPLGRWCPVAHVVSPRIERSDVPKPSDDGDVRRGRPAHGREGSVSGGVKDNCGRQVFWDSGAPMTVCD